MLAACAPRSVLRLSFIVHHPPLGYCMMLQNDGEGAKEYLKRSLNMLESVQKSLSEELDAIQSFEDGGLGEELEGVEER